jgi:hypothetical protein
LVLVEFLFEKFVDMLLAKDVFLALLLDFCLILVELVILNPVLFMF